ncbi:MAG: DUF99 family protein [Candidatus Thermoplasmatota archaeon]|nr:DUF99 family protein [Candidatus Thermoplasmatota archaeon]
MKHLKDHLRIMGVDDAPYRRGSAKTMVVLTICRLDGYLEGVLTARITTDGDDSASAIGNALLRSRFAEQVRYIISDGGCLGGFNVLDLGELNRITGIPVITSSDEEPDPPSFEKALKKAVPDWERRLELIKEYPPAPLVIDGRTIFIRSCGTSAEEASTVVSRSIVHGKVTEPVRMAHIIAGALFKDGGGTDDL